MALVPGGERCCQMRYVEDCWHDAVARVDVSGTPLRGGHKLRHKNPNRELLSSEAGCRSVEVRAYAKSCAAARSRGGAERHTKHLLNYAGLKQGALSTRSLKEKVCGETST